jgi:RHS repeat-associated protein
VTYAARYAPFGTLLWQQGTAPAPWGFAGEMQDPTGLIYLRARWYDPATGRFLTRDPLLGVPSVPASLNPYVYALNNPVLYTDPSGEFIVPLLLAVGAGAAIGGVGGGVGYALAHPGGRPEDYLHDAGFRRAVGVGALSGSVAGGVGFGVGGLVAGLPGLGGAVLGGALTSAAASGTGQVTANLLTPCVKWNTGLGGAMFWGGVTGGIAGGVGYGIRRLAAPSHPVNNSLPFRDPALRQQVGNVIESMDVAGNPPPGVRQGGARVNGQRMPGLYRGEGLPSQPLGYYTETDIWPGLGPQGSERLVFGNSGEVYYTPDHYHTFIRIR